MLVASHAQLFVTPWTVAQQAPLSMEFSRQEYWSGCIFFFRRIFPTQGSNLGLLNCRQILYYLSHQGRPEVWFHVNNQAGASQVVQLKTICLLIQETREMRVQSLGQEDPLEEGTATHSSILAWEICGQRSLVGYSSCSPKDSDTT